MSGSLWLRPGATRDSLPQIPRQRATLPAEPLIPPAPPGLPARDPYGSGTRPAATALAPPPAAAPNRTAHAAAARSEPAGPGPTASVPPSAGHLAPDPLDELADRLDALAATAVHPDEIAAILESDGMTDDHIRLVYGRADSFALAEDLYARTERRHIAPEPAAAGPWHTGLAGCLLRGVVFALPGLAYVLGAPLLTGTGRYGLPPGTVPLFAGAVTGWVWNQALAHRAYTWLGLGDRAAAVRALVTGAPAGALAGAAVAVAAAGPGERPAALFGAGQALYLAAATVLLVLGRERALLVALSPLAGAVPAFRYDLPEPLRVTLLLLSLAATTGFAALVLRGRGGKAAPGARRPALPWRARPKGRQAALRGPGGPPLARSLPYGLFGLGSGLLVLYAGADAVIALTLSMGPAEWLLHRFRAAGTARLRLLTTADEFRRAVTGALARCLGGYLAVLLVLTTAAALLWPGAAAVSTPRIASLLLVGAVLWLGLLLQAFGAVASAAVVCLLAAAAQGLAQAFAPAAGPLAAGAAAAALCVLTRVLLVRPTAHRV